MQQLKEIHKTKTIVLSEQTYQKLLKAGKMGMTFDQVVNGLLQEQIEENRR